MFAGPLATRILADQGADVVKVEAPGTGDLMRRMGIARGQIASTFHAVNRNKRSIVIDLRDARGRGVLEALVRGADVFVQGFRPGVVERLGIDEPSLRRIASRLVYVSISAWGESGPYAKRPAFDSVVQAVAGYAASQAGRDGVPRLVQNAITDKVTGLTAAQAITAALFARERGAGGQHVRLAMLDAALDFLWVDVMQHRAFVGAEGTRRNTWPHVLSTRDGHVIASLINDAMFSGAVRAIGRPELAQDARFARVEDRLAHLEVLCDVLDATAATFTTRELCERLERADVPHAAVTPLDEVETHPQVRANESLFEYDHPVSGRLRQARAAARFEATPGGFRSPAPRLGEHADEILAEIGFDADVRQSLQDEGIVGRPAGGLSAKH